MPQANARRDPVLVLRKRNRWLGWGLLLAGLPTLLALLAFSLPVIGNLAGMAAIGSAADCTDAQAGMYTHCWLWGKDLVDIYAGYGYGIFLAGIANPWLYWRLLTTYLPGVAVVGWHIALVAMLVVWWRTRKQLRRHSSMHAVAGTLGGPPPIPDEQDGV